MKDNSKKQVLKGSSEVSLLRIYLRGCAPEESLLGMVEHVTKKKKKRLRTEPELLDFLEEMNM